MLDYWNDGIPENDDREIYMLFLGDHRPSLDDEYQR